MSAYCVVACNALHKLDTSVSLPLTCALTAARLFLAADVTNCVWAFCAGV